MTTDEQECPKCAEIIKKKAKMCRFCNSPLPPALTIHAQAKKGQSSRTNHGSKAILIFPAILLLWIIVGSLSQKTNKAEMPEANNDKEHTTHASKNAGTCVGRGNTYLEMHDYARAKDEYKKARSILGMLVAEGHSEFQPSLDQIDAKILECKRYE